MGCPHTVPTDTRGAAALGGVAICSPDSSLPVEIMRNLQPGACPKSADGVYVMNGSRAQDKHVVNNNKIIILYEVVGQKTVKLGAGFNS